MVKIGSNVLEKNYWNLPHDVDLANQAEPPFFLPNNDWNAAVGIQTRGRTFTHTGPIRSTVVTIAERLFGTRLALLYRGQGTVRVQGHAQVGRIDDFVIQGRSTTVLLFELGTGMFAYEVMNAVDFTLVAIVEADNIGAFLRGDVAHPVLQAVWHHLPGYRRLMDWCGVECALSQIDVDREPYTWSDYDIRPGRLRKDEERGPGEEATHGTLLQIPRLITAHPGDYWVCLPGELDDAGFVRLGQKLGPVMKPSDVLEYTNEAWNPSFAATHRLQNRRPAGMHWAEWYVREAVRCITLFEQGAGKRFKRVACWQSAGGDWAFGLDWNQKPSLPELYSRVDFFDALAIAPYLFNDARPVSEFEFVRHMDELEQRCRNWKAVADMHGKPLWAYEGLIEIPAAQHDAVRDTPEMGDWIYRYLVRLAPFFEHFCAYTAMGPTWGLIEGRGRPVNRAFGVLRFIAEQAGGSSGFVEYLMATAQRRVVASAPLPPELIELIGPS